MSVIPAIEPESFAVKYYTQNCLQACFQTGGLLSYVIMASVAIDTGPESFRGSPV